jgi:hypothetical protein
MVQDVVDLRIGQPGLLQDRALAFGELGLAGAAGDHADPLAFAAPAAECEISTAPEAGLGAVGILATEMFDGMHVDPPRSQRPRDRPFVPIAHSGLIVMSRGGYSQTPPKIWSSHNA